MEIKDFYIDEPVIASMFIGELGWYLQRYQGYMRYLKQEVYKDYKFLIVVDPALHVFVNDFVGWTVDLPEWFKELKLDTDCYEAVLPESTPGSLTPPEVYSKLIEYIKRLYNNESGKLILPPRGCNLFIENQPQIFTRYTNKNLLESDKPILSIIPRKRSRAPDRNVPEYIWREVVEVLKSQFKIVLLGTPNGACLADYEDKDVINLISYNEPNKTEETIRYLNNSMCSISSQSGGTHISLLSGCPSYIIGHERDRHAVTENRLNTPVTFRYVIDYRCIDAQTIIQDVFSLLNELQKINYFIERDNPLPRPSLGMYFKDKNNIIGAEIGTYEGLNSLNILNGLDIKKLYLIDPYDSTGNIGGMKLTKEQADHIRDIAHSRLERFADKIVWIDKKSEDAIDDIEDDLDFVYVDGDHRYQTVKKEIELYYPKIKDGGLMAFHDYDAPDENNGVVQAVEEFFNNQNIIIHSDVCKDDPRTKEGWILKPTPFHRIIDRDVKILEDLINAK